MNFYMNNKKFKHTCFFLFILWFTVASLGCGSWEKKTVMTYQSMGAVLESSKTSLQALCDTGTLDAEQCADAREAYNEAVTVYKLLGDTSLIALDSGDITEYNDLRQQLMKLLDVVNQFFIITQ